MAVKTHKPGTHWKTASGKYAGKDKQGLIRYFTSIESAKNFIAGKGTRGSSYPGLPPSAKRMAQIRRANAKKK